MERYSVHDEYMTPSEHGNVVLYDDAQRALDAAQELSAAWAEKARQYELELEGDPQNLHGQGRTFGLRSQLATLQAQLRQVEGQSKRQAEEAVIVFAKYTTLRQLVEVHTKQLTELTIIPIGCSREQELRWTQSIKDLRAVLAAKDAGKVSTSIIGKQVPPSQWDKNAGVCGDIS